MELIHYYSWENDVIIARSDFCQTKLANDHWWWTRCPHEIIENEFKILTPIGNCSYFQYLWQIEKEVNILKLPAQVAAAILCYRNCRNQFEYWGRKRLMDKIEKT